MKYENNREGGGGQKKKRGSLVRGSSLLFYTVAVFVCVEL
jgi:hypothetical protein